MKNKRMIALMWALALLPLLMVALCWTWLPEQVPVNWGFDGQVSYGSRNTLWVMAGLAPLLALLLQLLPKIDPRRENYEKFRRFYETFAALFPLFVVLVTAIMLLEAFRPGTVNVGRVIGAVVSLLFLALGAFIGKVKTNWFMGFRTPWALSDPDVWNKTQRLGGWVFFLAGLVNLPMSLLAPEKVFFFTLMGTVLGGSALTYFMSWKWYRDKQG